MGFLQQQQQQQQNGKRKNERKKEKKSDYREIINAFSLIQRNESKINTWSNRSFSNIEKEKGSFNIFIYMQMVSDTRDIG